LQQCSVSAQQDASSTSSAAVHHREGGEIPPPMAINMIFTTIKQAMVAMVAMAGMPLFLQECNRAEETEAGVSHHISFKMTSFTQQTISPTYQCIE